MENEERTFPLTRLTSEVLAVTKEAESQDSGPESSKHPARQLKLRRILEEIIRALGNSAESRQYYFLAQSSDEDTDSSESDPELDSCSL